MCINKEIVRIFGINIPFKVLEAEAKRHNREMHARNGNIEFEIAHDESSTDVGVRIKAKICNDQVFPQVECIEEKREVNDMFSETEKLRQHKFFNHTKYPSTMGTLHYSSGITNVSILGKWRNVSEMIKLLGIKCYRGCKKLIKEKNDDDEDLTAEEIAILEQSQAEVQQILSEKIHFNTDFAKFLKRYIISRGVEEFPDIEDPCDCQLMWFYDELREWGIGPCGEIVGQEGESRFFDTVLQCNIEGTQDSMRWITVGQERYRNNERFKHTSITTDYKEGGRADWRALGLRVALYDDLRENRITMPSGVEWSVPEKEKYSREIVFSSSWGDQWGYEAVFIDKERLENIMKGDKTIQVLPTGHTQDSKDFIQWNLFDDSTTVIVLNDIYTGTMPTCGKEIWILSHLSYPLAAIVEGFQMGYITASKQRCGQYFFRNSSLVDLALESRKIIFVSNSPSSRTMILEERFVVTVSMGNKTPVIYKFDDTLKKLVTKCLTHNLSLKRNFTDFSFTFFKGDLDWVEIELLMAYLTTRWVPSPEVTTDGTIDKLHWVLNKSGDLYHEGKTVQETNSRNFGDFGHLDGVLGFDHVVAPWRKSQYNPVIWIGTWTTEAEFMCGLGSGQYCAVVFESQYGMYNRLMAGGWDRLNRACLMRTAFEEWKRAAGLRDEICCPHAYEGIDKNWRQIINEDNMGKCVESIAKMICTPMVRWNWQINKQHQIQPTYTGIRRCVNWSNSWLTTEWKPFSFNKELNGRVHLSTKADHWTLGWFVATGKEHGEERLDWALMRIDPNKWRGHIKYNLTEDRELLSYEYRCESRATERMHKWLGWAPLNEEKDDKVKEGYGWGIRSYVKHWNVDHFDHATIVLSEELGLKIQQGNCSEGMHLTGKPKEEIKSKQSDSEIVAGWKVAPEDVLLRYRGDCSFTRHLIIGKLVGKPYNQG